MISNKPTSYERVATTTSQYPASTNQQHPQVQEGVVGSNYGYLTQGSNHQGYTIYNDSTFPHSSESTTVPTNLQHGYIVYQPPGQNTIPGTCILEFNKTQTHPPVTTTTVVDNLELQLEALFEGNVPDEHTIPNITNIMRTPVKPMFNEAVGDITRPSISDVPPKGQRSTKPHGKMISHKDKHYTQRSSRDESTGNSSCDDCSTQEGRTYSPGASTQKRVHANSKKTHNPDREESRSSAKRDKKSGHDHGGKPPSERKRSAVPERSPSREVSVARSMASENSSRSRIVHPAPSVTEQLNDEVFRDILDKGGQQIPQDIDNSSNALSKISRVRQMTQKSARPVTWESLEHTHLEKGLRGTDLARETIKAVIRHCKSPKAASSAILYITWVEAELSVCLDKRHRIQVRTEDYLLCSGENSFGYTYEDLSIGGPREVEARASESLHMALYEEKSLEKEHSLDNVFRSALREMVGEIHTHDIERSSGLDNPVFISGRYLELRLIQKIREYYMELRGKDVIRCIVPMNAEDLGCDLQEFVKDNASTPYLRRLIGVYGITRANYDDIVEEKICTPQKMRVWTTIRGQRDVNVQIQSHILAVATKAKELWTKMNEEEKSRSALSYLLATKYMAVSEPFLQSHDNFLSAVLRGSELMAWMCFGVTTNAKIGCSVMVDSFMKKKVEDKTNIPDKSIVWNYPLAAIYRREQPMIQRRLEVHRSLDHYRAIDLEDCI